MLSHESISYMKLSFYQI